MANRKQITNCQKNVINNFLRFLIDEDGILYEKKFWEKNLKKKINQKRNLANRQQMRAYEPKLINLNCFFVF